MRHQFTTEVHNLALSSIAGSDVPTLLSFETQGPFWEVLAELDIALAVSREYEHFIVLVGGNGGNPWQSALALPHPSGMFVDAANGELIVSSTRTPNQIFWLRPLNEADYERDVVPDDFQRPDGMLYLPYRSSLLPGTLYIHDIAMMGQDLYATITGHNFLARLDPHGGWQRVWWPACVDGMGRSAFNQNYLQLNSVAIGKDPASSFYTAFSDETTGPKPWKTGYGPKGRGVVFSGASRDVACRELTCPHSAKLLDGQLWLCNSGYGEIGLVDGLAGGAGRFVPVARAPGFTRGMAFAGRYAFVGLSRVIDFYEPYAPGLTPSETHCGIAVIDRTDGTLLASLYWPEGYQIYDVQVMAGARRPMLPMHKRAGDGINPYLRFLG